MNIRLGEERRRSTHQSAKTRGIVGGKVPDMVARRADELQRASQDGTSRRGIHLEGLNGENLHLRLRWYTPLTKYDSTIKNTKSRMVGWYSCESSWLLAPCPLQFVVKEAVRLMDVPPGLARPKQVFGVSQQLDRLH